MALPKANIEDKFLYPESDGKPMADNTKQYEYITTTKGNLDILFRDDPDVFVAGDLLWYAVRGKPAQSTAPDVMVAFGRPKGDRGSYKQWEEANIAPQVVFEILSPSNSIKEMTKKFGFYQEYGSEEYYVYDPDKGEVSGWVRNGERLIDIANMHGWVSPLLGIRFYIGVNGELLLYYPDGRPFLSFVELGNLAEKAQQHAEAESQRAETASQRAETESQRADQAEARAARLAERLRALGVDPAELDSL